MRADDRRPEDVFTDSGPEQRVRMVSTMWREVFLEFAPAVCEDGLAGDPT